MEPLVDAEHAERTQRREARRRRVEDRGVEDAGGDERDGEPAEPVGRPNVGEVHGVGIATPIAKIRWSATPRFGCR
ncbi:hypothetical protein [Halorussus sp. MSC15.2]|uniref:hypothetical protein n=1 Tax=Halorussus sp. MSC15.2 TaxID=2283638 RepID=UPI0019689349|nr:hypothetical protein [Halorussus sp. MSC15.2]